MAEFSNIMVTVNDNFTSDDVLDGLKFLSSRYPEIFVVETEGHMGQFLIFYYYNGLLKVTNDQSTGSRYTIPETGFLKWLDNTFFTRIEEIEKRLHAAVTTPTVLEGEASRNWHKSISNIPSTLICESDSYAACAKAVNDRPLCCSKVHFERIIMPYTDVALGDCSYLDTCFKGKHCKYVHYRIRFPTRAQRYAPPLNVVTPPQFINANLSDFNLRLLGNDYAAMIIDPPWDIHTNPNFEGGCSDSEFSKLRIDLLQKDGVVFLWVTGRVLDLGHKCLKDWGYDRVEELIWLKTNQLGRTICTGRTGHWLNHTKEHVLVGFKGRVGKSVQRMVDTDVIVSTALGKSQKPEELYGIIDRLVGSDAPKLELFGRRSNIRPGWITVGNELRNTHLIEPHLRNRI